MSTRRTMYALMAALIVSTATLWAQSQTPDERARELVNKMTLDEKIQELHGIKDSEHYRVVPGVPRLGIPDFHITNGPAGAGPGGNLTPQTQAPATALPAPIALAATWDIKLANLYGTIVGGESKDLGNGLVEAPTINIVRVPQNGRTFEGYGEDPYLAGQMSINNIIGIQSQGEIANVKHYAANNQETDRFVINEEVDERALREIYLPAFEVSIKQGHSASVMCAYNKINGTFCCENDLIMNQILKKEWGFDGFITSDFGAVHSTVPAAMAGLDLEMPTGKYFGDDLKAAVESGKVPMSVIDDKLIRRFRSMMSFGIFDHPSTPKPLPAQPNGTTARRLAEESMVLLKNDGGVLPLNAAHLKSIAVIGPAAVKAITGGGGSSHVVPLYTVDPVDGIRGRAGDKVTVNFSDGSDISKAVSVAHDADVAIVMVADNEREGRDHLISLEGNQDELVQKVAAANPHTVVVVKSGSAVLMPWADQVPAILEAWYPGEEDGNAVGAVLFGYQNPSGKLPLTFPKNLADVPANTPEQYPGVDKVAHYSEGVFVGYRHYDAKGITPLFPFGHGLSYTTFSYKDLKISPKDVSFDGKHQPTVSIDLDVTNTGSVTGAEVVQLYLGMPSTSTVPQPPKQLKGFEKVSLAPREKAHIHLTLDARAVSYWDVKRHDWVVAPGDYKVLVGSSSRDIRLQGQLKIKAKD
ncbi:MAG TPA: glycoside hydrolase family 3 C-terminal domain-containing protein [Terriglobales bacterium]|nr:glycoside hydrolase family 3 C-terminal domain-containing protein [Terriglobales bacterium]